MQNVRQWRNEAHKNPYKTNLPILERLMEAVIT